MSERLGEALLELRTSDKGFNAGIKGAEGGAQKLGGTLDRTSAKADNLGERMNATGAALQRAGQASSAAAGAALQEAAALYRLDAATLSAGKATVAIAQADYRRASAALAAARADGSASKEAIAAATATKQKAVASLEAARADYAQAIAAQRVAQADHEAATAAREVAGADDAAALASQRAANAARTAVPALDAHAKASRNAAMQQKLLLFQLNDVGVSLASGMPFYMVAIQQGSQMAQIYGPGEGGLGRALKETGKLAVTGATAFPLITTAVAASAVAVAGMTSEINKQSAVTVGYGDVALGVWQTIVDGLSNLLKPAIDAIGPWFASAWNDVVSGTKTAGNAIINSFQAVGLDIGLVAQTIAAHFEHAVEAIKIGWSALPAAIGDVVYGAANRVVTGIEEMINGAVSRINALNDYLPEWAQFDALGTVDLPDIANPNAGAASDMVQRLADNADQEVADVREIWSDRNAQIAEIMANDPLGDFFAGVKSHAIENAIEREKKKKKTKGSRGKTDEEKYQDLIRSAEQFIETQNRERDSIGLTEEAAARLRYEQELLNNAANDNIKLTPQQTAELKHLAAEMAAAEAETNRLQEAFDFSRETVGGFVDDMRSGLESGKGIWKSWSDAALGALDRVIDKILNEALDALFQLGNTGTGGATGGGWLASIGNLLGSVFSGFHAKGGLIPSGTFGIVGEEGPEPVIGTSRGAMVLPNSTLRQKGNGSQGNDGTLKIDVGVDVDDNGRLSAYVKRVSKEEASSAVKKYDSVLPDRVTQINQNPRKR